MRWGISGAPIPSGLPYASEITKACAGVRNGFPPCFAYAIAWNETIQGQTIGLWDARTIISRDGGHGLFQLTSSFPSNWDNALANANFAIAHFLLDDCAWWAEKGYSGSDLIRAVAASFNAGIGDVGPPPSGAWGGHVAHGNVDAYTTKQDGIPYGKRALAHYLNLITGKRPI